MPHKDNPTQVPLWGPVTQNILKSEENKVKADVREEIHPAEITLINYCTGTVTAPSEAELTKDAYLARAPLT